MAKLELRERALDMRKEGASYSQIKGELGISKGTLSVWLREYPLSRERINELRGNNEKRIERYRETRARTRLERLHCAYQEAATTIGIFSERELFLLGLMLYWAEGTKAQAGMICMTNTDPLMIRFFIAWLECQGINRSLLKVKLHLYADMDIRKETDFWKETIGIPETSFRKPYIKTSLQEKPRNYKGRFGHGTCNVFLNNIVLYERVMSGIEYIRNGTDPNGIPDLKTV